MIKAAIPALLALLPLVATALDEAEIKALADESHSREGLLEELKIYPEAREYRIEITVTPGDGKPVRIPAVTAKEKVVDGKYVVSTFRVPHHEEDTIMAVTFDRETRLYHKWIYSPDFGVHESLGVSAEGSRSIAWRNISVEPDEEKQPALVIEHHGAMQTTFTEIYLRDGEEFHRVEGVATVTRQK